MLDRIKRAWWRRRLKDPAYAFLGEAYAGEGVIYTFSVMRRSPTGPYAIGYVTLDEGPAMLTNFVDCDLDQLAIGQHDFEPAYGRAVITHHIVAVSVFERVAGHAAPTKVGNRHHQWRVLRPQFVIKLLEGYAGLDSHAGVGHIDFQHAVHPAQIQHDTTVHRRSRATIAEIAPHRAGPDMHPGLCGDPHRGLHFRHTAGLHDKCGLVPHGAWPFERVAEFGQTRLVLAESFRAKLGSKAQSRLLKPFGIGLNRRDPCGFHLHVRPSLFRAPTDGRRPFDRPRAAFDSNRPIMERSSD